MESKQVGGKVDERYLRCLGSLFTSQCGKKVAKSMTAWKQGKQEEDKLSERTGSRAGRRKGKTWK